MSRDILRGPGRDFSPNEAVRKLNPQVFSGGTATTAGSSSIAPAKSAWQTLPGTVAAARITTDEERLNKTEKRYLAYWRATHPGKWIGIQNITLKLGFDLRFTPDFNFEDGCCLVSVDVKGTKKDGTPHIEEDALVKIKTAAHQFPWRFQITFFEKSYGWVDRIIKP